MTDSDPARPLDPGASCDCPSATEDQPATEDSTGVSDDRWIPDPSDLDADLPADLRRALSEFVGGEIETLADFVGECRRRTGGGPIGVEDLCHAETETPHCGELDGETYYFACFYDAVALAALADGVVDVRTESPDGTVVEARAVGTAELSAAPSSAVFSFGISEGSTASDGEPAAADVYEAVCPYVKAFPDRAAYESWAERVPAATVAMPLDGATELAAALAE